MVDISIETLIEVYRLAALGKIMNGLIHNLNGPLQTIGLDMEMMDHTLSQKHPSLEDLETDFEKRIHRMESGFDVINHLIRTASSRGNQEEEDLAHKGLSSFLEDEFTFLQADLYFKHHVDKQIFLPEDAPSLKYLPKGTDLALGWFLQGLVEELEREKLQSLRIDGGREGAGFSLTCLSEGPPLSRFLTRHFSREAAPLDARPGDAGDFAVALALTVFRRSGVEVSGEGVSAGTVIRFSFPTLQE